MSFLCLDDDDGGGADPLEAVLARIPPDTTVAPPVPSCPGPMDLSVKEEEDVTSFMGDTCGCTLGNGSPCSKQFTVTHVTKMRMTSMELTRSELDMALLGQISACTNHSDGVVVESRHTAAGRKKIYSNYIHQGKPVCPRFFRFLHAVGTFCNL